MSIKPIIFSVPGSIPGILDGRKTQTRRVVKPQPGMCHGYNLANPCGNCSNWESVHITGTICCGKCGKPYEYSVEGQDAVKLLRPRYMPGDILWVRERAREFSGMKRKTSGTGQESACMG